MKATIPVLLFALLSNNSISQTVNFSQHVAPILYSKCSNCHREGSIGPFPLMTYEDAFDNAFDIVKETQEGNMPPWPPDPTFSRFAHERRLTETEISTIYDWVAQGSLRGDSNLAPPKPVFSSSNFIAVPDLSIRMEPYTVESDSDVYRSFVISGKILTDKYITSAEFVPANKKIVHHILLFYDTSGICKLLDQQDPKPGYMSFGGVGAPNAVLISGWVPGSMPLILPAGMGAYFPANADFVLQIHYAPGSLGETDSSSLNLLLSPPIGIRQVSFQAALNHSTSLINGPLFIPAGTVKTFNNHLTVPFDASILGVAPHMHLLGKTIKAIAVKPDGDTINLIRINDWHFHWQGMYNFRKVLYLPKNTELYGEATYDNTSNNPENPSDPPQDVSLGESTTNEMFLIYFNYLIYKPGDENISLETETSIPDIADRSQVEIPFRMYPNPAADMLNISIELHKKSPVSLSLYDMQGKLLRQLVTAEQLQEGRHQFEAGISELAVGCYICRIRAGDMLVTRRLTIMR